MAYEVIQAVILLIGLRLLLASLSPESCAARLLGVALIEFYTTRYYLWRLLNTLPALDLTLTSIWQWTFFLVESMSTVFICWSALVLIRSSNNSALATVHETALRARAIRPSVAVLIPTVSESREVLEPTIRAAMSIDYPCFEVLVLDDDKEAAGQSGERSHAWLPGLCAHYGARYLRRSVHSGAKAGNLNHGISNTQAEVLLVLDSDFRAKPNILWRTVGMLDERVALLQTPQHYYSSDPIQHNLGGARFWTEEQRHFFDVVLPARDAWANALCVGTGFVVRREALGAGGFATGCLSEDVYGGYVLVSKGFKVRYLNECLSYGAAADSLPEYIRQRVRWCQGILQATWLPYGPLRAPGLSLVDRLFYLEMPLYWMSQFGLLACVLLAPLVFLFTGVPVFQCSVDDALSNVLPRIVVVSMVGYWISRGKVMPIVTEITKLVGLVYILGAMLSLVVHPSGKPFVPTLKAEARDTIEVHTRILMPFLVLGGLILTGVVLNLATDAGPVRWDEFLLLNIGLALYVVVLLFFCCLACIDRPKDTHLTNTNQTLQGRWLSSILALARLLIADPCSGQRQQDHPNGFRVTRPARRPNDRVVETPQICPEVSASPAARL